MQGFRKPQWLSLAVFRDETSILLISRQSSMENKALRGTVADFERVKRAFGPEEVERAVEDTRRREAQEREQKKAKRKFSRGAR